MNLKVDRTGQILDGLSRISVAYFLFVNGVAVASSQVSTVSAVAPGQISSINAVLSIKQTLSLLVGDVVRTEIRYVWEGSGVTGGAIYTITVTKPQWVTTAKVIPFQLGHAYDLAATLPKLQQRTFLRDITQLYNLIYETNVTTGQVKCYTSNQFYLGIEQAESWDDKIDFSRKPEFRKYDQIERELIFKFTQDDKDVNANAFESLNGVNISDETQKLDDPF